MLCIASICSARSQYIKKPITNLFAILYYRIVMILYLGMRKKSRLTVKPTIPLERKKNNNFFLSWCLKFDLKICLISQITINFKQILYPYIQLYSDEKNFFLTIKNDFSPAKSVETHNT